MTLGKRNGPEIISKNHQVKMNDSLELEEK